jgi:GAF domain-containing protein
MIRSAMCVPLTVDGQVKAAFYLDARMPRAFTDDEVRLVTAVAKPSASGPARRRRA